jgi:hypothetical protein
MNMPQEGFFIKRSNPVKRFTIIFTVNNQRKFPLIILFT